MENQKISASPLTDHLHNKASFLGMPLSGTFELTPTCNFSCRMCYVRQTEADVLKNPRERLTMRQWLTIADEACNMGMLYLLLTGGEPTIWPDFWQLYHELIQMGLVLSINTNGSLLDDKAIAKLVQDPPRRANITLYGAEDQTYQNLTRANGMYARVDRAITELKKAGINVKLNCSLTPWNVQDLERMVKYAEERELILDISSYMFPPLRRDPSMIGRNERFTPYEAAKYRLIAYRLQHGEEAYKSYLRSILEGSVPPPGLDENCVDPLDGRIRCRAGKATFWITWDGYMLPCGMLSEPKVDITKKSFHNSWKEINQISNALKLSGVCSSCKNLTICHSCAAMAQTETGSIEGIPIYLCEMVREMKKIAFSETNC